MGTIRVCTRATSQATRGPRRPLVEQTPALDERAIRLTRNTLKNLGLTRNMYTTLICMVLLGVVHLRCGPAVNLGAKNERRPNGQDTRARSAWTEPTVWLP